MTTGTQGWGIQIKRRQMGRIEEFDGDDMIRIDDRERLLQYFLIRPLANFLLLNRQQGASIGQETYRVRQNPSADEAGRIRFGRARADAVGAYCQDARVCVHDYSAGAMPVLLAAEKFAE